MIVVGLAAFAGTAGAATLEVTTGGNDAGDCQTAPCATIAYAVGQGADGDVIEVGPGEFTSTSTILLNKAITIAGAQAGVDARDRDLPANQETVIVGGTFLGSVIRMSVPGATVDGVTVRGHEQAALQTMISSSGYTVRNSILTDNDTGLDLETTATDPQPTVIERNRFEDNNRTGLQTGIYGDGPLEQATIRDNLFTGHVNVPINIAAPTTANRHDLAILDNDFVDERQVIVTAADGVEISGNTFTEGRSRALSFQGGVQDLEVRDNVIEGGVEAGILFVDRHGEGPNGTATITGNSIAGVAAGSAVTPVTTGAGIILAEEASVPGYTGTLDVRQNRVVGNAGGGIQNDLDEATVDAPDNWWGCNAGPGGAGCDATSGQVESSPNAVLSLTAAPTRVPAGTPIDLTASVDTNSAGQPVDLAVLEGRQVTFGASAGTVSPAAGPIQDGSVGTVFSSTSTGPATVTATLDGQQLPADLFVGAAAKLGSVTVTGSGKVGGPLACAAAGVEGAPAPSVAYAWLRDGSAIAGQAGTGYTPTAGDAGAQLACRVTVSNEFGSDSADSAPTTIVAEPKKPTVKPPKAKVAVPASGKVVAATIKCESACQVNAPKRVKVKIRGKVYTVKVVSPKKVGAGKSAKVRLVLPKAARRAIKGTSAKVKIKVVVVSEGRRTVTKPVVRLKGKKAKGRG